jgi:hypothetical protein
MRNEIECMSNEASRQNLLINEWSGARYCWMGSQNNLMFVQGLLPFRVPLHRKSINVYSSATFKKETMQ